MTTYRIQSTITDSAGRVNLAWFLTLVMFVILFVGDLLSGLGIVSQIAPNLALVATQLMLLVHAITVVNRTGDSLHLPGMGLVLLLLSVSFISALFNGQGIVELAVFLNAVMSQYVVLVAMMNLRFSGEQFKKLNFAIFVLCALQIPVGFYRMMTSGNDVFLAGGGRSFGTEAATGTLGRAGGSLGTTFPLIVIGFLFSFYLWRQKKTYALWMLGFIFFSFCTGKRAFPLFLPVFLTALYLLLGQGSRVASHKMITLAIVGVVGLLGGVFLHPSLNPSGEIGGNIDLRYALEMATANETQVTWDGKQAGRYSTSAHLFKLAKDKGPMTLLLGHGPATMIKSGLMESTDESMREKLGIAYGVTGAGWLFLQVGLVGVLCYLWLFAVLFRHTLRIHKRLMYPYWRAICGGLLGFHLVIFFDTLAYSTSFAAGKLLPALYWYFLAQVLSCQRNIISIECSFSAPEYHVANYD